MSVQENLRPLLQKEMSRKEFLITLGFGFASIFGFSTLVHILTGRSVGSQLGHGQNTSSADYGDTTYGDGKD